MKTKLEERMTQVTIETLERLAFMFAFPDEYQADRPVGAVTTGRVPFKGPFSGTLAMTISRKSLRELTSNMLGLDEEEEPEEEQMSDALKETMNVICGNLLPAIAEDEAVFDIGVPVVLAKDKGTDPDADIAEGEPSARVVLDLDEGFCTVSLWFDGGIPEDLALP